MMIFYFILITITYLIPPNNLKIIIHFTNILMIQNIIILEKVITMKKITDIPNTPATIGPYSQAIVEDDFLYISG